MMFDARTKATDAAANKSGLSAFPYASSGSLFNFGVLFFIFTFHMTKSNFSEQSKHLSNV